MLKQYMTRAMNKVSSYENFSETSSYEISTTKNLAVFGAKKVLSYLEYETFFINKITEIVVTSFLISFETG